MDGVCDNDIVLRGGAGGAMVVRGVQRAGNWGTDWGASAYS